uniref:HTH La-type RNA-binding domain-containing protein n=1 Tax=Setaria digitata TaxID=48799 RepID=A0A915PFD6_9BILA
MGSGDRSGTGRDCSGGGAQCWQQAFLPPFHMRKKFQCNPVVVAVAVLSFVVVARNACHKLSSFYFFVHCACDVYATLHAIYRSVRGSVPHVQRARISECMRVQARVSAWHMRAHRCRYVRVDMCVWVSAWGGDLISGSLPIIHSRYHIFSSRHLHLSVRRVNDSSFGMTLCEFTVSQRNDSSTAVSLPRHGMAVTNEQSEPGAFFMCTETSPRCYIIQRVNSSSIDRMLDDMMVPLGECDTPPTPMLPWWFTAECENQLLAASDPPPIQVPMSISTTPSLPPPLPPLSVAAPSAQRAASTAVIPQSPEQIKKQLKAQLEYYFSRENLMTDRFLRCQMDNDQYVPIRIIAGFPKVKRLTNDYNLVVKVLRESSQVQVDEKGQRVRAVSKRCTIILREIPESTDEKEVASMFAGGPPYLSLQYGLNNSWYVTFESEEATERAFLHLQNLGKTFNNKPICARIKTGGAPYSEPLNLIADRSPAAVQSEIPGDSVVSVPVVPAPSPCSSDSFDLGQILASYGYVPCATFKPGTTVVHITSNVGLAANRSANHQRLRGAGSAGQTSSNFRGSNSRGRGGFVYNQRVNNTDHRDFGTSSIYQHGSGRRSSKNHSDAHRDGYRDRNSDSITNVRSRGRQNRLNNFSSGAMRSRTPVELQKTNQNDNIQQRCDYDQSSGRNTQTKHQRRKQRDVQSSGISSGNNKNVSCPPIICLSSDESKKREEQQCCSKRTSDDDSKQERSSSRKTVDTEYSFEEGAFPCLSEETSPVMEVKESKSREKPTFSSVAAGKREEKKEAKEKKSYAQTLKQNNG